MTSYHFFKIAVIESEIYFRVRFWWWQLFVKMEIYGHTKFRWDISIHGWDKTTSAFEKRTAAILKFFSGFFLCLIVVIGVSFCIGITNFVKIKPPLAELWFISIFFKMAAGSHSGLDLDNIRPTHEVELLVLGWSSNLVLIGFVVSGILRFSYFAPSPAGYYTVLSTKNTRPSGVLCHWTNRMEFASRWAQRWSWEHFSAVFSALEVLTTMRYI